jgi:hypothetical protein
MTREELLAKWKTLEEPKPNWEAFKRLIGVTRGDIDKAITLWRKTKDR